MSDFGTCECGHPIYEHGRSNRDGNQVWVACRILDCGCSAFRAADGSLWPAIHAAASVDDPDDLDRDTDAWVDGQVVLEHEREPDIGERVCSHGLRLSVHCKQCSLAGFCGCRDCVEAA